MKQLGAGGHSTVHLAKTKENGSLVVAKFIHSSNVWHWHMQGQIKVPLEIVMMKTFLSLKIPEIIKYYEHFEIGDRFIIMMEYLGQDWIDLYDYIETYGPLDEGIAKIIFKSVANVVSKMHHLGYTHNDIKGGIIN